MEIDYEKAYKAALETATQWIKDGCTDKERICLESAFPQLRESEDERIRKLLVWQVHRNIEDETNDLAQSVYDGIKGHDPDLEESIEDWKKCLAYLEKQKEQPTNEEMLRTLRTEYEKGVADTIAKYEQKEQKEIPLMNGDADLYFDNWIQHNDTTKRGCFQEGIRYAQRLQKEQKLNLTAKWNGVYKICPHCKSRMIRDDSKVYTSMPPQYGYNCPKCGTMEFDTVMYDNPEMEEQKPAEYGDEFIAEAEEYASKVNCGEYKVEITEAYIAGALRANNKPAEWSEEDRLILDSIIAVVEEWEDTQSDKEKAYYGATTKSDWLKSLRPPQYCENCRLKKSVQGWKPSEEQMKALDKALYYVPEEIGIPIAEIYGHFNKMKKKLM